MKNNNHKLGMYVDIFIILAFLIAAVIFIIMKKSIDLIIFTAVMAFIYLVWAITNYRKLKK